MKDPEEAKRYMGLDDGASLDSLEKDETDRADIIGKPEDRRTIDLSKNVLASFILKIIVSPELVNLIFVPLLTGV